MAARAPSRSILIPAALLTQIGGSLCILLGTVATALTLTTSGERALLPILIGWVVAALSAVIAGGLIYRGNLPALVMAVLLDGVFGVVLIQLGGRLGGLLRMLSVDDVAFVSSITTGVAVGLLVASVTLVIAIPQARRFANYVIRLDDPAASLTGVFQYVSHPPDDDAPASNALIIPDAASTAPGFPPPPPRPYLPTATMRIQVQQGKRRLWFAVIGLLIGVGSGVAVLVATSTASAPSPTATKATKATKAGAGGSGAGSGSVAATTPTAGVEPATGSGAGAGSGSSAPRPVATGIRPTQPILTPQDLLVAEHAAIGRGDVAELAALAAPHAFAFGLDADEVAEGPAAIEAMLRRDLLLDGKPPADGLGVDGKYLAMGEWRDHAWIAEEIEVSGATTRRYAITQLVAKIDGQYSVVAWHWGMAVPDAIAEKLAKENMLPALGVVPDRVDGSDALEAAVRASLGSREGFGAAWSARADAFNFGSAGERLVGGALIKKLFGRMRADLALGGGGSALIVSGNLWDKSQKSDAWVAYAAANVAFAPAGHPSQTFRVLAIYIKEDEAWQLVQTQFSNGGPIVASGGTIKR